MSDLYGWLGEGVGSEDEWRIFGQLLSVNTVLVKCLVLLNLYLSTVPYVQYIVRKAKLYVT